MSGLVENEKAVDSLIRTMSGCCTGDKKPSMNKQQVKQDEHASEDEKPSGCGSNNSQQQHKQVEVKQQIEVNEAANEGYDATSESSWSFSSVDDDQDQNLLQEAIKIGIPRKS